MIRDGETVVFQTEECNDLSLPLSLFLLDVAESRTLADLRRRFVMGSDRREAGGPVTPIDEYRDDLIRRTFGENAGNVAATARTLNMSRTALSYHVKRLGLRKRA